MRYVGVAVVLFAWLSADANAQSFSCSMGRQAACLDYGDVVCNSLAKCVRQNSICFDAFTCDSDGFVCKSVLDDAVDEIQDKVRAYNTLVSEFNDLNSNHKQALADAEILSGKLDSLLACVRRASTLDDAQSCRSY